MMDVVRMSERCEAGEIDPTERQIGGDTRYYRLPPNPDRNAPFKQM
jgi:hypothetical protein